MVLITGRSDLFYIGIMHIVLSDGFRALEDSVKRKKGICKCLIIGLGFY